MNIGTYMAHSRRTRNSKLSKGETVAHALTGLTSEVGEINSLFQHFFQGEAFDKKRLADEIGDLMWFTMELLDAYNIDPSAVLKNNVAKLKKRYPEGFSEKRSAQRHNIEE